MRLFFAIWPPPGAAEALCAWAQRVRRRSGGSAVPARNIHLTLAFLGEVDEGRVPELKRLGVSGKRHSLPVERAGYWSRNRILWAGPEQSPAQTVALAGRLQERLAQRRFRTEPRPFAIHVTLLRNAREPQELPSLPKVDWPVQECVLVHSEPTAQGSRYRILERYPLA